MPGMLYSIPILGTEPASENRIRSCCGSTPGIRFYCKPVTLVRCREIRGEIRFSGRVGGKWLCEMTSAFIINELRGARALRLFCGRSSFPPPITRVWIVSRPFFCLKSPRHAGFLPLVLRVATSRNAQNWPLSRPGPSLFSVWPAGRRRWRSCKINNLRAPVHRQPRPAVKHQTPPSGGRTDCMGTYTLLS